MGIEQNLVGDFSFSKSERITSKKTIQKLFSKGCSFYLYPFKIIFLLVDTEKSESNQVLISVPKANFKKAVDRNTIKRRIREGYRLNKNLLTSTSKMWIAYIYTPREILPSPIIHEKVMTSLKKLNEKNE